MTRRFKLVPRPASAAPAISPLPRSHVQVEWAHGEKFEWYCTGFVVLEAVAANELGHVGADAASRASRKRRKGQTVSTLAAAAARRGWSPNGRYLCH